MTGALSALRRLPAILAIAATASLAAGLPAAARDGGAKSKIEITALGTGGAKGKVTSGRSSCKGGRKVSLFTYDGFVSDKVAITQSKGNGKWKVDRSLEPGTYFAKVDHVPGCRYAVSKNEKF
jgi:hypothetical protein